MFTYCWWPGAATKESASEPLIERFGYVLTVQPGASAEQMEALITEPLENALMALDEISDVDSYSRAGVSQVGINIQENLSASEVEDAWTVIRSSIEGTRAQFPEY